MIEQCVGCLSFEKVVEPGTLLTRCHHEPETDNKICPCLECVIKTMCNQPCNKFMWMYPNTPLSLVGKTVRHVTLISKKSKNGDPVFITIF